jgi:hypothetical protein
MTTTHHIKHLPVHYWLKVVCIKQQSAGTFLYSDFVPERRHYQCCILNVAKMASTNLCVDTQPFCIENGQNLHGSSAALPHITYELMIYVHAFSYTKTWFLTFFWSNLDHSICSRLFPYVFSSIEGDKRFAAPPQQEIGCGAVSEMYMHFLLSMAPTDLVGL